jgi:hypothetical protein
MNVAPESSVANSRCAQCGAEFRCGMEGGDKECWCASLPPLMSLPESSATGSPAAGCFCPACLKAKLAQPRPATK